MIAVCNFVIEFFESSWGIGLVSGFLSSCLASYIFYVSSGRQLRDEANAIRAETTLLREINVAMARALENAHLAEFHWVDGVPKGLVFNEPVANHISFQHGAVGGGAASVGEN